MSLPEVLLWRELRKRPDGFKFRRQFPKEHFAGDFACLESRLIIEIDGEAHERGNRPQRDDRRDARLAETGFQTMRVPAVEVLKNLEGALIGILEECRRRRPLHRPAAPDGPPPRSGED